MNFEHIIKRRVDMGTIRYTRDEKVAAMQVLIYNNYNMTKTANLLGIRRPTIGQWVKEYKVKTTDNIKEVTDKIDTADLRRINIIQNKKKEIEQMKIKRESPMLITIPKKIDIVLPEADSPEKLEDKDNRLQTYLSDIKIDIAIRLKELVAKETDIMKLSQSMKLLNDIELSWKDQGGGDERTTNYISIIKQQMNFINKRSDELQGNRITGDSPESSG